MLSDYESDERGSLGDSKIALPVAGEQFCYRACRNLKPEVYEAHKFRYRKPALRKTQKIARRL